MLTGLRLDGYTVTAQVDRYFVIAVLQRVKLFKPSTGMTMPRSCPLAILGFTVVLSMLSPLWAVDWEATDGLSSAAPDSDGSGNNAVTNDPATKYRQADKGPLEGKNFSPHYLIFFNLPGLPARPPTGGRYALGLSSYLSQEFLASYEWQGDDAVIVRHSDFENLSLEAYARWYPSTRFQLGATMRLIGYWGGVLDWPVDTFHELFGFPPAGREAFPINDVQVDYTSNEGYHFYLDKPQASLGDLDLWAAATVVDTIAFAAAIFGGLKIPTGSFDALSGSGGVDLAMAALFDLRIHRRFSAYLNVGLTLALYEPHAAPDTRTAFAQAIVALEYALTDELSFLIQGNLKSPSMHADILMVNNLGQVGDQLGFPQTNILFGIRRRSGAFLIQAYMEEDALTNNGVDFSFNFSITRVFATVQGNPENQ